MHIQFTLANNSNNNNNFVDYMNSVHKIAVWAVQQQICVKSLGFFTARWNCTRVVYASLEKNAPAPRAMYISMLCHSHSNV